MQTNITDIDTYIAGFPKETRQLLEQLRKVIRKIVPEAEEKISYGIPTFYLYGNLVHFAGYKNHIGFYPGASGIKAFEKELSHYPTSKGTVQFPIDKSLPLDLITKIVQFRIKENETKAIAKKKLKICPQGHKFYKTSDCPVCPVCEKERKPQNGFLSRLSAPARRALEHNGITTLQQLAKYTKAEILMFHGMGPASIPKLEKALKEEKLSFRK